MKIGIDVTACLTEKPTGIANYVINLYQGIENACGKENVEAFVWLSSYKYRKRLFRHLSPARISWHYKPFNIHKLFNDIDISHSTDAKFLNLPGTKKVATVHDLALFKNEIAEIQDYTTEKFKNKVAHNLRKIARNADRIITDSRQTKLDFLEMFPDFDADRIDPIYLAGSLTQPDSESTGDEQILEKFGLGKKSYFMFIGAISVRKNLINMIEGFRRSGLSGDTKFVLIGFMSMGLERIMQTIKKNGLEDRVVLADYIDESYIPALYRNSLGLAFATFYEGFGIPIIEAMKFNTPVMYGNIGSAPEIGRGHGVEVDPFSVSDIAAGFRKLTEMNDSEIEKAANYAAGFTWEKTTKETLEVYRKML